MFIIAERSVTVSPKADRSRASVDFQRDEWEGGRLGASRSVDTAALRFDGARIEPGVRSLGGGGRRPTGADWVWPEGLRGGAVRIRLVHRREPDDRAHLRRRQQ